LSRLRDVSNRLEAYPPNTDLCDLLFSVRPDL